MTTRALDHLVLPVRSLEAASDRHQRLGFTVAPRGKHPFGTGNTCVYFPGGTFLEPLAVFDRPAYDQAVLAGNVFVARDHAYRFRVGQDGFSALVTATSDADADHALFRQRGQSAGDPLTFSRAFRTPSGEEGEASFKLAFSADLRAPDCFFFACERVNVAAVDRSALERHDNGAISISGVLAVEDNPSDFQYLLQTVTGNREIDAHSFGIDLALSNCELNVLTPAGFTAAVGASGAISTRERGLRLAAIRYAVDDLDATRAVLQRNGVDPTDHAGRLIVPPAPGQGAFYLFERRN